MYIVDLNQKRGSMTKELVKKNDIEQHELSVVEQVVLQGDLGKLTPEQRVIYYNKVCESAGLNPFTRPFEYISLNGKLTLYAKKDATEQLRKLNGISIEKLERELVDDLYVVTARARTRDGRTDESTGAVVIGHLKGDAKANAIMKAETKAKRRVTLSISGMGWCDESEVETIPNAKHVDIDISTGEVKDTLQIEQKPDPKKLPISEEEYNYLNDLIGQHADARAEIMEGLAARGISDLKLLPVNWYKKACAIAKAAERAREEELHTIEVKE